MWIRKSTTKMPWMSTPELLVATVASISEVAPGRLPPLKARAPVVMRRDGLVEKLGVTPPLGVILIDVGTPPAIDIRSPGTKCTPDEVRGRQAAELITESGDGRNNPGSCAKTLGRVYSHDENQIGKTAPEPSGGSRQMGQLTPE